MGAHVPERSCVVTRERGAPADLVRLVVAPDGLVHVDYRARLPGRGAWVTPKRSVIEQLEKKPRMLTRAFRRAVRTDGLLERIRAANAKALADALSLAARSGCLHGGKDRVRLALADGALAVLLAADASPRLAADLERRSGERLAVPLDWNSERLGAHVGKGPRSALAILPGKPGAAVLRELRRFSELR